MSTLTRSNLDNPAALSLLRVALEALVHDQLRQPIAWIDFLAALQRFCAIRGWCLEYNFISDYSYAIFAHEDVLPTVSDEERGNLVEQPSGME